MPRDDSHETQPTSESLVHPSPAERIQDAIDAQHRRSDDEFARSLEAWRRRRIARD